MNNSFNWSKKIDLDDGSYLPADCHDRAKYAYFLTNFLSSQGSRDGYVLNLNACWGAGKTYFLKRWAYELKNKHPVVYIDAWEQDYSKDPMLTVISSVLEQLNILLPDTNENINNISKYIAGFLKVAAPALTKDIVKKISGINIDELQESLESPTTDSSFDGSFAADITKALIIEHNEKLKSISNLRHEIFSLVEAVNAHNSGFSYPAFVFIDELDRCRPSYAVEMLEVIKHFFNVKGVVFVIATDSEQLQHTIKSIYGEGFDAKTYLGRFFKRRFTLNDISRFDFVRYKVSELSIPYITLDTRTFPILKDNSSVELIISDIANAFRLSLRETEQLIDKFCSVLVNDMDGLNLYALAILCVLHEKNIDLYNKCFLKSVQKTELCDLVMNELGTEVSMGRIYYQASYSSNINGIEPIWERELNYNSNGSYITISDLICNFNEYIHFTQEQRNVEISTLRERAENTEGLSNKDKMHLLALWHMCKIKVDAQIYKNWIELAVSFND
ncbi:TPA: KAP family P-loop NTPase fold protein [Photobacterium damselae]